MSGAGFWFGSPFSVKCIPCFGVKSTYIRIRRPCTLRGTITHIRYCAPYGGKLNFKQLDLEKIHSYAL